MRRQYARRLFRQALENGPESLLANTKLCKPEIFELLLEHCDEQSFSDPAANLSWAEIAPALADAVADSDPTVSRPRLKLLAHSILGSTYRRTGNLFKAERSFNLALGQEVADLDTADCYRRFAYVRLDQRQFSQALELNQKAIKIYRLEGDLTDRSFLACALVGRGEIHHESGEIGKAIIEFSTALNHVLPNDDPQTYYAAVHNLVVSLVDHGSPTELALGLRRLKQAYRQLTRYKKKHIAKYKLRRLQALIQLRFGATRQAELYLREAQEGLLEMGATNEAIVLCLDRALLYLQDRRIPELIDLTRQTYELLKSLSIGRESLATLGLWFQAVKAQQISYNLLMTTRKQIAQQLVLPEKTHLV